LFKPYHSLFSEAKEELTTLYKEQLPSIIFIAIIGFASMVALIADPNGSLGSNASKLFDALFSGLKLTNIFFLVTFLILFLAALVSTLGFAVNHESRVFSSAISDIALRGITTFFAPIGALSILSAVLIVIFKAQLASKVPSDFTYQNAGTLLYAGLIIFFIPVLLWLLKELLHSSKTLTASMLVLAGAFFMLLTSVSQLLQ